MYVCCRSMKVQKGLDANGQPIMEMRQPGDDIPEAEGWANPQAWVNRGFIRPKDGTSHTPQYDRSKLQPARSSTDGDIARATALVPQPGQELPGYQGQGDSGIGDEGQGGDTGDTSSTSGTDLLLTEDELLSMRNDDLKELGETFDLKLYGAKEKMVASILKAQAVVG